MIAYDKSWRARDQAALMPKEHAFDGYRVVCKACGHRYQVRAKDNAGTEVHRCCSKPDPRTHDLNVPCLDCYDREVDYARWIGGAGAIMTRRAVWTHWQIARSTLPELLSKAMVQCYPELRRVVGFVDVPTQENGRSMMLYGAFAGTLGHRWCETDAGRIIDPSAGLFWPRLSNYQKKERA